MKTTDLESTIEKPKERKLRYNFENSLTTDDGLTRYVAKIRAHGFGLSVGAYISLARYDYTKIPKKSLKLEWTPLPKLSIKEELKDVEREIWKIEICSICFAWSLTDFNRYSQIGHYGIEGNTNRIYEELQSEARRKNILIQDNLINLLTVPYLSLRNEFKKHIEKERRPVLSKGVLDEKVLYSDQIDEVKSFQRYVDQK
ncbi:hypothetical protein HYU07_01245 [Candidatus Woesearchaeota archaeon]|nr:hypothetical protein [Candidatus Woesearchaeota archaeon]